MKQFVILGFGVDPINWPSFIEIGEIACSAPAWCTHGLTLNYTRIAHKHLFRFAFEFLIELVFRNVTEVFLEGERTLKHSVHM